MKKTDVVKEIAKRTGFTMKDITVVVDATLDIITDGVITDGEVSFSKFGKFVMQNKGTRDARNPKTGDIVTVPAHGAIKFKPSASLKEAVK